MTVNNLGEYISDTPRFNNTFRWDNYGCGWECSRCHKINNPCLMQCFCNGEIPKVTSTTQNTNA